MTTATDTTARAKFMEEARKRGIGPEKALALWEVATGLDPEPQPGGPSEVKGAHYGRGWELKAGHAAEGN